MAIVEHGFAVPHGCIANPSMAMASHATKLQVERDYCTTASIVSDNQLQI